MVACVASAHTALTTGPTDACKTPTPGGPVPMPYPNVAVSSTPGPGYTTKTLAISTPMWTKKSKVAVSNGDNPGVALGVVSSRVMGMDRAIMCSNDVKCEGGGVVRTLDKAGANG